MTSESALKADAAVTLKADEAGAGDGAAVSGVDDVAAAAAGSAAAGGVGAGTATTVSTGGAGDDTVSTGGDGGALVVAAGIISVHVAVTTGA